MRQQAVYLTNFMMGHLSLVKDQRPISIYDNLTCKQGFAIKRDKVKNFHTAIWWIFCYIFLKFELLLICNFGANVDLKSSPNWSEILYALENSSMVIFSNQHVICFFFSITKPTTYSYDKLLMQSCKECKSLSFTT